MKKSHIKPYVRSTADHGLRAALRDWRDTVAVEQFGRAVVKDFGADIFMPTDTISRIVNCAHAGKLHCLADLKKEISWSNSWLDEHGETIIDKIHAWFPPPMSNKVCPIPSPIPHLAHPPLVPQGNARESCLGAAAVKQ
ncbi:hypothetical protein GLOTRDRAFT_121895 [Gloeophyllum trabeum ATCC 11539]|uniref:Uncharacterized protein n=1 Tax=Gloeophyllum trabeum (strain ATCC 11539 / FP-39264 / Madison 617) TaxID=670483 RepID=S7Q329_GLOTA|nr:uncharacterized protein GLOTRDRAFT_121895 [Gloeophyllum trabeum ATCC 11539]EPQ53957.1 hypothetical protein GLOTRDRAFT_121895 [Gloeophyllum trabeum ATCC 11539]